MFGFKKNEKKKKTRWIGVGDSNCTILLRKETSEVIVKPDSKAEENFMKNIVPLCKDKDKMVCKLGVFYPDGMTRYELSKDDFEFVKKAMNAITITRQE